MLPLIAGLGGVLGLGSGIIGSITSGDARAKAMQQAELAAQGYLDILVPDPKQQQLLLARYKATGKLDPVLQQVVKQANTKMATIQRDPSVRSAQLTALKSLQDVADRGGKTLEGESQLNKVRNDVAAENRGRVGAIQSSFARRGMGQPGGMELAAQMSNAQNETQRESEASLDAAAQAKKQALQALMGAGDAAGKLRSQDFNEQAQVAKAQDDIERFNASALNSVNANNTAIHNRTNQLNFENNQDIANRNTGIANEEQVRNKNIAQQQFDNQMQRQNAISNARNRVGATYNAQADRTAGSWSNIGQGAIKAGVAGQMWADRKPKDDEEDENLQDYED